MKIIESQDYYFHWDGPQSLRFSDLSDRSERRKDNLRDQQAIGSDHYLKTISLTRQYWPMPASTTLLL